MSSLLSTRDYLRIQEAASVLGVSEQTLRNWDRSGKLRAHRHPINGYRLYRTADLHAVLREIASDPVQLELPAIPDGYLGEGDELPPAHWRPEVALDPKHRPQRWDTPSSTVRRDWRKYPQEAHVVDSTGTRYRRLAADEIAILQGFDPR